MTFDVFSGHTIKCEKTFDQLSPNEKRVAVAKDVILSLNSRKIIAENGTWVSFERRLANGSKLCIRDSLQKVLPTMKPCEACALGATFISMVRLGSNYSLSMSEIIDENINMEKMMNTLDTIFPERTQELLEYLYELGEGIINREEIDYTGLNKDDIDYYLMTLSKKTPKSRLITLMQNLIDNDGELIIPTSPF